MAVEVGNVKKIIPALKGIPVTENIFSKQNPVIGRISTFNTDAIRDTFVFSLSPERVKEPPMDINANGIVTAVIRAKVLSIKTGKKSWNLEKKSPAMHPRIRGLEIKAFKRYLVFCPMLPFLPECQINVETARTFIMGMANPIRIPKYLMPDSPRVFMTIAIPIYVLNL
jgi:hypothetical protein